MRELKTVLPQGEGPHNLKQQWLKMQKLSQADSALASTIGKWKCWFIDLYKDLLL